MGKNKNVKQAKSKLEDDVDDLFKLPLPDFIAARKTLAARLKKEHQNGQADRVKALVKPAISAWTVNQLYWNHRDAFDRLIATGQNFRRAQSSRFAGKVADMREALDARREALAELATLASAVVRDAGHNPTPDMISRVTTTLEAMSAYAALPDGLAPGRLTQDVDPPGFDSLASFVPGPPIPARTKAPARLIPFRKAVAVTNAPRQAVPTGETRQTEKARREKIAAAKASLQEAKRVMSRARARAQNAEAAQKAANANAKEKEKQRRIAEERFEKARSASEGAARRAQGVAAEVEEAAQALSDAEHALEVASKELESLN
ncbi:MAG: hypothetical protein QOK48_1312 [Blastocatellia bacterium]|nr:hypothetical protein [Blastocatellia bacterium]